jgi:hypothetical protein
VPSRRGMSANCLSVPFRVLPTRTTRLDLRDSGGPCRPRRGMSSECHSVESARSACVAGSYKLIKKTDFLPYFEFLLAKNGYTVHYLHKTIIRKTWGIFMNRLTPEEVSFFKREGYLFKRKVFNPELMTKARDALWAGAPARMKRDDPSTWFGPFREDEENPGPDNRCLGHMWKFRAVSSEEWMLRMAATDEAIWTWVEQLIGEGTVVRPERVRGIYCRLPETEEPEGPFGCHVDAFNPQKVGEIDLGKLMRPRISLAGLIAPIPPRGGCFTVWPRTHRAVYEVFASLEGNERHETYHAKLEEFNTQTPVEACGEAGDILFWHNLLGHAAGHNRSEELQLREAVLADWDKEDNEELEARRPHADMWHEWSEEIQAAPI